MQKNLRNRDIFNNFWKGRPRKKERSKKERKIKIHPEFRTKIG